MTRQLTTIAAAVAMLRSGDTVAFPTETVYGLGARYDDAAAVRRVFAAKERPADNPLIVHLAAAADVCQVAREIPTAAQRLLRAFSPGPVTLLLPRAAHVLDVVTAGLDSVAVRIPRHPLARELIRELGIPVVAPSANRSGRPSPTTWQAVWEDLSGRIGGVLLGAPTEIGLESTVVDTTVDPPQLLRSGGVTFEQLREVCPQILPAAAHAEDQRKSPGMRYRHYAPQAVVVLYDRPEQAPPAADAACFSITGHPAADAFAMSCQFEDVVAYAKGIFEMFRQADRAQLKTIYCQRVSATGLGAALMDRLTRAAKK